LENKERDNVPLNKRSHQGIHTKEYGISGDFRANGEVGQRLKGKFQEERREKEDNKR
jgi:hypothetical protein